MTTNDTGGPTRPPGGSRPPASGGTTTNSTGRDESGHAACRQRVPATASFASLTSVTSQRHAEPDRVTIPSGFLPALRAGPFTSESTGSAGAVLSSSVTRFEHRAALTRLPIRKRIDRLSDHARFTNHLPVSSARSSSDHIRPLHLCSTDRAQSTISTDPTRFAGPFRGNRPCAPGSRCEADASDGFALTGPRRGRPRTGPRSGGGGRPPEPAEHQ